jgi:hypothetical protein
MCTALANPIIKPPTLVRVYVHKFTPVVSALKLCFMTSSATPFFGLQFSVVQTSDDDNPSKWYDGSNSNSSNNGNSNSNSNSSSSILDSTETQSPKITLPQEKSTSESESTGKVDLTRQNYFSRCHSLLPSQSVCTPIVQAGCLTCS